MSGQNLHGEIIGGDESGATSKEIEVKIPSGTNTLNVIATDINGVTSTNSTVVTSKGPIIDIDVQGKEVNLMVVCDKPIAYISYNWDGTDEEQIQVNAESFEKLLEVEEGLHTLNVVAVDTDGRDVTQTFEVKGDNKPTLDLKTDNRDLFIEAQDDEGLTRLIIEVYGTEEKLEYEINDNQFNKTISIQEGELPLQVGENRVIFTLYNINGIKNIQYKKIYK